MAGGGRSADSVEIAKPVSLELLPHELVMEQGKTQQLAARAHYSDGSERDVTNLAVFLTNNETSAAVTPDGLITCGKRGEAFVMARFATFTVGTPVVVIPPNDQTAWSKSSGGELHRQISGCEAAEDADQSVATLQR